MTMQNTLKSILENEHQMKGVTFIEQDENNFYFTTESHTSSVCIEVTESHLILSGSTHEMDGHRKFDTINLNQL